MQQVNYDTTPVCAIASLQTVIHQQRTFFNTGATKDVAFRMSQLKRLRQMVIDAKADVIKALQADLGRPEFEAYAFEVGALREIDYALKHLPKWAKPQRVSIPIEQVPSKAWVQPEPLGVVLIIGPWNYPFQLMLSPVVAAIAAGNCALLKPSELAPATSRLLATLIGEAFDPAYVAVVEGGVETSQALLEERFDHIFFTGGTAIGRVILAGAAKHLTPVTLELGGKSPCIVDVDVSLEVTARRIVWGKFVNAGQTCLAPDYLLVNRRIKPALMNALTATIREFYGDDPAQSSDFGRIINHHHFSRLKMLLDSGSAIIGGQTNDSDRYIAPTILDNVSPDSLVMQDEIFGPILPVLEYEEIGEAIAFINAKPKPLALYLFSRSEQLQERVLRETSSGGVCLNDTIMHVGVSALPFGGVGDSGIGYYHGKAGFDALSHRKSILQKPFWPDLNWRYAPYSQSKLSFLKRIIG